MYSFLPCNHAFFQSMQLLVVVIIANHECIRNSGRDADIATDVKGRERGPGLGLGILQGTGTSVRM